MFIKSLTSILIFTFLFIGAWKVHSQHTHYSNVRTELEPEVDIVHSTDVRHEGRYPIRDFEPFQPREYLRIHFKDKE